MKNSRFLSCDPGTKFSNKYRTKNMADCRQLVHGQTHVSTLNWQVGLRDENPKKDIGRLNKRAAYNSQTKF